MRYTPLIATVGAALIGIRSSPLRRYIRAVRVVRAASLDFPATVDHSKAPAFGEAVERCARKGMSVSEILLAFTPARLHSSDQMIFLQHMETVARVYAPHLVEDIRAEINARVPSDASSLEY